MRRLGSICSSLLFTLSLGSCDCTYSYHYEVFNDSASVIWVHWTHDNLVDSIEITPNGIAELFVTQHGIEQCRKGPFFRDVNQDLQEIEVRLNDSITSEKNYLLNENWSFTSEEYGGAYRAQVILEEFE
jgi:hypothetical protein